MTVMNRKRKSVLFEHDAKFANVVSSPTSITEEVDLLSSNLFL